MRSTTHIYKKGLALRLQRRVNKSGPGGCRTGWARKVGCLHGGTWSTRTTSRDRGCSTSASQRARPQAQQAQQAEVQEAPRPPPAADTEPRLLHLHLAAGGRRRQVYVQQAAHHEARVRRQQGRAERVSHAHRVAAGGGRGQQAIHRVLHNQSPAGEAGSVRRTCGGPGRESGQQAAGRALHHTRPEAEPGALACWRLCTPGGAAPRGRRRGWACRRPRSWR